MPILSKLPSTIRGVAVVMALFVVALVSAVVLALLTYESIDITRTGWITQSYAAYFAAQGGTQAALEKLKMIEEKSPEGQAEIKWPLVVEAPPFKEGNVRVTVWDPLGRFNINNLQDPAMSAVFIRLMLLLDPNLNKEKALEITQAIKKMFGLETNGNLSQGASSKQGASLDQAKAVVKTPFREGVGLTSVSELRLVPGISAERMMGLAPYVIALPLPTLINVNTASALLLQSLSEEINSEDASLIVEQRQGRPYEQIEDFLRRSSFAQKRLPMPLISVNSQYFLIEANVKLQEQTLLLLTLVMLEKTDPHHSKWNVLWQSQNTL